MRPLNITIEGFGTYYKKTYIDFEKLGKKGLYLITGDTGSGKTTIFDAISYALFGGSSGDIRKNDMLRSASASIDDPTYVELNFSFKDKEYYVKRNPTYERRSKKGEGVTTEQSSAILKLKDGTVLANQDSHVTKEVESILGINKDQFCQIAMIAQGNFQKILFEESKNRLEIFRTLFCTEKYERLQKSLKEKLHELKDEKEESEKLLKSQFNNILCDTNDKNYSLVNDAKNNETSWSEKGDLLKSIIKNDEDIKDRVTSLLEKNTEEFDKVKIQKEEVKSLSEDKDKLSSLEKEIEDKKVLVESFTTTLTVRKEAYDNIPNMTEEKGNIKKEIEKYEILEKKEKECTELKNECDKIKKEIEKSNLEIKEIENKINYTEEKLSLLKNSEIENEKVSNLKEKLEDKKEKLDLLLTEENEVSLLKEKTTIAQNEYIESSKEYEISNSTYSAMYKAFLDGQAGLLAQTLEDEKPCPVCGSVHHPSPCKLIDSVPDEKQLKKAKKKAEEDSETVREKSETAASINAQYEEKNKHFISSFNSLFINEDKEENLYKSIIEKEIEDVNNKREDTIKELVKIKKDISDKLSFEASLPAFKISLEKEKTSLNDKEKLLSKKEAEKDSLEKVITEEKENIQFNDIKAAKGKLSDLERKIDIATKSYEDALNNLQKGKDSLSLMIGQKTEIEKRINDVKNLDVEEIEKQYITLKERNEEYTKEKEDVVSRLKVNYQVNDYLANNIKGLEKIEKEYKTIKPLSDTANGELLKRTRLYLETYVQKTYFKKVLHYANTRLLIMSDGQYELVEKKNNNRVNIIGLDIDVKDHWNGKTRSVKTLSGGESFQASLALALGLSDAVSSFAGGISIDTMFIDEGFGSLDSEALQKAFEALSTLTEGDKLIGIISHVSALKDKIDRQIIVKKTRDNGSFVSVKA